MLQNIHFTISIDNNSNRVIGSSEEKFVGISKGNLIKIGDFDYLYTIVDKEKFSYIKNFTVVDSRTILIDEDINISLQQGDIISISYKEYELLMIYDIIDKGLNYNEGDELKVIGGITNFDISSGSINPTILKVNKVSNDGGVSEISIIEKGKYLQIPTNPVNINSSNGINAQFELKYKECDNRTTLDRTINSINIKDNKTFIYLNYSIPQNIKQGKLYVEKNYLIIDSPYMGTKEKNIRYEIFRNFTPYHKLPLMIKNSLSPDVIYNKAMLQIDLELKKIKDKIGIS